MTEKLRPLATLRMVSLLGLLAAVLSILLPALLTANTSPIFLGSSLGLFPGDIFGAMLAIYFVVFAGIRSIWNAIALVIASTFAYYAALFSGMLLGMFVSGVLGLHTESGSEDLTAGMVAPLIIAGVLGAFLVLVAVLRLYAAENSWPRVVARSFWWSLPGGVLALVGWGLGSALGGAVWSVLASLHLNASGQQAEWAARSGILNGYSLHIVWQVGMGVVVGNVLSETPLIPATVTERPARGKLNLANEVVLGIMILALAWFLRRSVPDEFRQMHWQLAYAKHVADTPSADNLPHIELQSADAMLILTPFGEYLPRRPSAGAGHYVPISGPQPQVYSVRYSPVDAPDGGPNVGSHVDVHVEEWPTAAWAKWKLDNGNLGPALNVGIEQPVKFGNRVVFQHAPDDRWGPDQTYAWLSQDKIVTIEFSSVPAEQFLEKYLQKYPSSL